MAGTDGKNSGIQGAGSGEALENERLAVPEGVGGEDRDGASEAAGKEEEEGAAAAETVEGAENDERGKDENEERQGRDMGDDSRSGLDTFLDSMPIVHVCRSFRLAGVLVLILGTVAAICPVSWEVVATVVLFYPVSVVLFWFMLRRRAGRSGPPADMAPTVLALLCAGAALLLSGDSVPGGLLLVALAIFFCGISTGEWLVVVAERRNAGLRGALMAVWRLEGKAREQAWRAMVGQR